MMSAEKIVEEMLRPLEEVCILMQDRLSSSEEVEKAFVLHREQWTFLARFYSDTLKKIKEELLRMLEPLMATLNALFSAMKAAEKSFLQCVAPHVGFSNSGFKWLQSESDGEEQKRDLRLWIVKDALRHILDRQVLYRHFLNLCIASVAVYDALLHVNYLNLLGDVREGEDLPPIYTHGDDAVIYTRISHIWLDELPEDPIMEDDEASKRLFFTSSVAHETDWYVSEMILERLRGVTIGEKLAARIQRLVFNPTQFRKTYDRKSGNLGKGSFGSVKFRRWIFEENQVAVKKGYIGIEEIEIQARVRHPHLLPLLCCTWNENDDDSLLRVTEQMDSNLDKLIDDASRSRDEGAPPFPLPVSVEIMLQISMGMRYLHEHGIVHRDLKPANILVSGYHSTSSDDDPLQAAQFLRVKVADFGTSKENFRTFNPENTYKHETGFYSAPEVVYEWSNGVYSRKADVYSFAMVCYRILCGKQPFHDYHTSSMNYGRIRKEELRPNFQLESSHSMALMGMVQHCWRSDPSERPDFAQIARFLWFMKMCVLQRLKICRGGSEWREDIVELLKSADLFSTYCKAESERYESPVDEIVRICAVRKIKALTSNN